MAYVETHQRDYLRPQLDDLTPDSVRTLRTGNEMPVIGLGTWMLTSHTAAAVQRALELGYHMVDTSADYKTQFAIGQALRGMGLSRQSIYLTLKVEPEEDGYKATVRNLEQIGQDYANLVLIHRAPERGVGERLWDQLQRARAEGLTRDIGVCSYKIGQLKTLVENTNEVPAVHQLEWSPFGHSLDMLTFCRAREIQLQAYCPLMHGKRLDDERLAALAQKYGKSPAQVILRWNLQHGVVPIPKAYREDHQRDNLDLFDFALDEFDMGTLDGLNEQFSALEKLDYL